MAAGFSQGDLQTGVILPASVDDVVTLIDQPVMEHQWVIHH